MALTEDAVPPNRSVWVDQAAKVTLDAWQQNAGAAAADVTLVTGSHGSAVACHGVVLAACSPLFRAILSTTDPANPAVIVVTDVTDNIDDVRSLVEFMYAGRLLGCSQDRLDTLVRCAKSLGITGLAEYTRDNSDFTVKAVEIKKSHELSNQVETKVPGKETSCANKGQESPEDLSQRRSRSREAAAPISPPVAGPPSRKRPRLQHSSSPPPPLPGPPPPLTAIWPTPAAAAAAAAAYPFPIQHHLSSSTTSRSSFRSDQVSPTTATAVPPPFLVHGAAEHLLRQQQDQPAAVKAAGILDLIREDQRNKIRQARTNWLDYSAVGGSRPLFNVSPVRNLSPVTAAVAASSSSPQAPGAGLLQCRSTQSNVADIKNNNSHQKKSIPAANSKGSSSSSSPAVIKSHKSSSSNKASKLPSWSQDQLQEAITSVITQRMRFTQASSRFNIPKGTLYDNILGKSRRMKALEEVGLTSSEELAVLEYCCEISTMPYNRRTSRSLKAILDFVSNLRDGNVIQLTVRKGFKWWWAFCKKYSIISLYFDNSKDNENQDKFAAEEAAKDQQQHPQPPATPTAPSELSSCKEESEEDEDDIDVEGIDDQPVVHTPPPPPHPTRMSSAQAQAAQQAAAAAAAFMAFFPSPAAALQMQPSSPASNPPHFLPLNPFPAMMTSPTSAASTSSKDSGISSTQSPLAAAK